MKRDFFNGKVIIITGASLGIGSELAYQLAERGALLALASRNQELLQRVTLECEKLGGKAIVVPTDVSDESQCKRLIETTVSHFGKIDILINNAGFGVDSRFLDMDNLNLFRKVFDVNFFGGVYCTHYALKYLKEVKGQIVAISSIRGKLPSGTADGYGASKHAMTEFYASLRNELSGTGVSVTVVFPNWVSTGITSRAIKADGTQKGEISVHEKGAMTPEKCANVIINCIARKKHDVVMTFEGNLGLWLHLIAPRFVNYLMKKKTEQ